MAYRAVVFDLDGTLLNSLAALAKSANALLAACGRPPHPTEAYRYFVGNGSRKLVERILPDASAEDVEDALARYLAIYGAHLMEGTAPYDGIPSLLSALAARGLRLAVCTNKEQAAAERLIAAFFPAGTFAAVVGARPDLPKKPDPAGVNALLASLGVRPEETVYLGDSGVDMETATRAGALPAGALWGFREREELVAHGARILLAHPMELLDKVPLPSLREA